MAAAMYNNVGFQAEGMAIRVIYIGEPGGGWAGDGPIVTVLLIAWPIALRATVV